MAINLDFIFNGKDNVSKTALKCKGAIQDLTKQQKFLSEWADKGGVSYNDLNKVFKEQGYWVSKGSGLYNTMTGKMKNTNTTMKSLVLSSKKFKSSFAESMGSVKGSLSIMLPVMFGFQNIGKAMKSAIDPALELVGATQLYQQMLAIKYLPTALKQLDAVINMGDAWMEQDEGQREIEGDMLLLVSKLADLADTTAQNAMLMGALGDALPTMSFKLFGTGVEISGRQLGTFIGLGSSVALGLQTLQDENGSTIATFSDLNTAIGITTTDKLGALIWKLKETDTSLEGTSTPITNLINKFFNLTDIVLGVPPAKNINVSSNVGGTIKGVQLLTSTIDALTPKKTLLFKIETQIMDIGTAILTFFERGFNYLTSGVSSKLKDELNKKLGIGGLVGISKLLGIKQYGGYIPGTGLYQLHAGERVVTAGGGGFNFNPTVNINANISSDMDIRGIANKLNNVWASDLRSSMGR